MTTNTETSSTSTSITVDLDTPCGPVVTYGEDDDFEAIDSALPPGYEADYTSQITLAPGRYRCPLVRRDNNGAHKSTPEEIAEFFGWSRGLSYAAIHCVPRDFTFDSSNWDPDECLEYGGWSVASHPTPEEQLEGLDLEIEVPGCGGRDSVVHAELDPDDRRCYSITLTLRWDGSTDASEFLDRVNEDLAQYKVRAITEDQCEGETAEEMDGETFELKRNCAGILVSLWDMDDVSWDEDDDDDDNQWEPMMNYAYPLPGGLPQEDWHRLMVSCTIVTIDGDHYLALTGGGMDLSWEICETYLRCGLFPPTHFATHLPAIAGRGQSLLDRMILDACRHSLETARNWLASGIDRLDEMRGNR
jgi:hypothetical protein